MIFTKRLTKFEFLQRQNLKIGMNLRDKYGNTVQLRLHVIFLNYNFFFEVMTTYNAVFALFMNLVEYF
jgi:hypothetical protein